MIVDSYARAAMSSDAARRDTGQAREPELGVEFEAILLQSVFAPLAKELGFYGDLVVDEAARSLVRTLR
jgi:hypothetical protein